MEFRIGGGKLGGRMLRTFECGGELVAEVSTALYCGH